MKGQVDYSVYLVTDSTEAILGKKDLVQVVDDALRGGRSLFLFQILPPSSILTFATPTKTLL
jgi:thiamine-phosphate diphosphorylase/hydroxyethylthiazole kinase